MHLGALGDFSRTFFVFGEALLLGWGLIFSSPDLFWFKTFRLLCDGFERFSSRFGLLS